MALLLVMGVFGVSLSGSQKVLAATNSTLNFQARLETAAGSIVPDGNYNVQFKLYNTSSGGSALWTETWQNSSSQGIRVQNGYLSTSLGSIAAFPTTINWDQDLWVTMNIGGTTTSATPTYDGEMNPRLHLTGVPYAFRAAQLAQFNNASGFTSILSLLQPTAGNQAFQIADQGAAGTYTLCVQSAAANTGGCAPTTGGSGYIQNTSSVQSGANFNIGGSGTIGNTLTVNSNVTLAAVGGAVGIGAAPPGYAELYVYNPTGSDEALKVQAASNQTADLVVIKGTSGQTGQYLKIEDTNNTILTSVDASGNLQIAGSLDMASAAALNVGGTNATAINLGKTSGTTNIATTVNGTAAFKTNTNATSAFQLQNSSGTSYFTGDSTNQIITTKDLNVGYLATETAKRAFSDGFESNDFSLWDGNHDQTGSSNMSIDKAIVRGGKYAAKFVNTTSGHTYVAANFAGMTTGTVRAYVYVSSQTAAGTAGLVSFANGTPTALAVVRDQATGEIGFENDVAGVTTLSSTVLPAGSWHDIELSVTISSTAGSATIYMDGTSILSQSNINTGTSNLGYVVIGNNTDGHAITFNADDVSVDSIRPGDPSSLNVADSLHVSGTTTLNGNTVIEASSNNAFRVQDTANVGYLNVETMDNNVHIDPDAYGNGGLKYALVFGGTGSGEGISSDRRGGTSNKDGLDFYTSFKPVLQLANNGAALFKNGTDSATAFQVQNAAGTSILSVDTSGNQVNISTGVLNFGSKTRQMLNLWGTNYGIGVQSSTEYFRSDSDFQFYKGGTHSDLQGNAGGGTSLMTIQGNGNVSIGMGTTVYKLDVNGPIHICGDQTNCSHGRVYFGDNAYQYGSTNSDANNPWIGEGPSDSDLLEMSGSAGIWFQTGYTSDTYQYQSQYTESGDFCIDTTSCTHHLGVNGSAAASGGFATATPDIAEYITTAPDVTAYDVVAADPNNTEAVIKATAASRGTMVGVISDGTSGFMMQNAHYGQAFDINHQGTDPNAKPMTLAGRIPVHVTSEGGAIHPGDYLTASSTPGYAMKATHAGPTVGKALGTFDGTSGTVLALISLSYYDPFDGNHLQAQTGSFDSLQAGSAVFTSLNVSGPATLQDLTVQGTATFKGDISVLGTASFQTITVNGHIVIAGNVPTGAAGDAAGKPKAVNGVIMASTAPTVTVTGTDTTGTIDIKSGDNSFASGSLVHLKFAAGFAGAYNVVVTAGNDPASRLHIYVTKTAGGFDIMTDDLPSAATDYNFDYIVLGTDGS